MKIYQVFKIIVISALIMVLFACHDYNNPIDPEAKDYSGSVSEDSDLDGIGQWADVDEIELLLPLNGGTIDTAAPCLKTCKFDPNKITKYWIQVSSSDSDFEGNIVFEKNDYNENICCVPAGQLLNNTTYYWRAKAFDGTRWSTDWVTPWSFTVVVSIGVPQSPSPSNGGTISDTTPILDWEDISIAQTYHLQVNTDISFTGSVIADDDTLVASNFTLIAPLSDLSTYYWRVRIQDAASLWSSWSSTWSFTVQLPVPSLSSPADTSTISDTTPLLDWDNTSGAANYHIQVNTQLNFAGTVIVDDSSLVSSQYQIAAALSDSSTYYWRVKQKNGDGVWSDWSSTWSFNVVVPPPALVSPVDGVTLSDKTPLLDWNNTVAANDNNVQINAQSDFGGAMILDTNTGAVSQYQVTSMLSTNSTYYWRVRVMNTDSVWSDWSDVWDFTVISCGKVSSGNSFTMILKTDGSLWATGDNTYGRMGTGAIPQTSTPIQIMSNVENVSGGEEHTAIVKTDDTLWTTGQNKSGQLGDGTTIDKNIPIQILSGVDSASASNQYLDDGFTLIVKTDDTLWGTGRNSWGQLADGTTTNQLNPIQAMTDVAAVSTGTLHTMIIKTDETLWACGDNTNGALGDGTTTDRDAPVQITTDVAAVSAGNYYTMIIKTDDTLWACGDNTRGNLGDGTTTRKLTPVQIMSDVAAVSAKMYHTLILKTDGTLWACGDNNNGQLGDGSTTDRHAPVQVANNVIEISAGINHSMFIKNDGTIWGMGANGSGQLGDGTIVSKHSPVQILP